MSTHTDTIVVHSRRATQVTVPALLFDGYMPILGAEGVGVYMTYCHLAALPKGSRISGQRQLAKACGIGIETLKRINKMLSDFGMIRQLVPDKARQSRHISTHTWVYDPIPMNQINPLVLAQYAPDYRALPGWVYDEPPADDDLTPNASPETDTFDTQRPGAQLGTRNQTGGPTGHPEPDRGPNWAPETGPGAQLGTRNDQNRGPNWAPHSTLTHSLIVSEKIDPLEGCKVSECVSDRESHTMKQGADQEAQPDASAGDFAEQFRLSLGLAMQEQGWITTGWKWTADERQRIERSRDALTPESVAYALSIWRELGDSGKKREPFHPQRTLGWLITVCTNHRTNGRSSTGHHSHRASTAYQQASPAERRRWDEYYATNRHAFEHS